MILSTDGTRNYFLSHAKAQRNAKGFLLTTRGHTNTICLTIALFTRWPLAATHDSPRNLNKMLASKELGMRNSSEYRDAINDERLEISEGFSLCQQIAQETVFSHAKTQSNAKSFLLTTRGHTIKHDMPYYCTFHTMASRSYAR